MWDVGGLNFPPYKPGEAKAHYCGKYPRGIVAPPLALSFSEVDNSLGKTIPQ
jgi:hypothetical protein